MKLPESTLAPFRRWGKQGGKIRANRLSAKRKSEIARKAGKAAKRRRDGK